MKTYQRSSVVPSISPPWMTVEVLRSADTNILLPHEYAGPPRPLPVRGGGLR